MINMGTDIYMYYKNMTKKEKEAQIGSEIYKGNVGYLRASIGMREENALLRNIFPDKYWHAHKIMEYDFIGNHSKNMNYIVSYILKPLITIEVDEQTNEFEAEFRENILVALNKLFGTLQMNNASIKIPKLETIDSIIRYAGSVIDFLWLGYDKQYEKLEPKIWISL